MTLTSFALLFTFVSVTVLLLVLEAGRRLALARMRGRPSLEESDSGIIDGAVFGLLGLLIAFSFSGAASRFDTRRDLIVTEANAIGTAYLRIDLLPDTAQPAMRDRFRRYLDLRLAAYRSFPNLDAVAAGMAKATTLQGEIWTAAVAASRDAPTTATPMLFLPALNEMIDITTTRSVALDTHPPVVTFVLLAVLVLIGAFLAGYGMAKPGAEDWPRMLAFSLVMTLTVLVIFDFEYPRGGLIRIDAYDQVLVQTREAMR